MNVLVRSGVSHIGWPFYVLTFTDGGRIGFKSGVAPPSIPNAHRKTALRRTLAALSQVFQRRKSG